MTIAQNKDFLTTEETENTQRAQSEKIPWFTVRLISSKIE